MVFRFCHAGGVRKIPWYDTSIGVHFRNKSSRGIRRLRLRAGLTQERVAWNLGLERRRVGAWESGRNEPTLSEARMIAELYGVPLSAIPDPRQLSPFDPPEENPKLSRPRAPAETPAGSTQIQESTQRTVGISTLCEYHPSTPPPPPTHYF